MPRLVEESTFGVDGYVIAKGYRLHYVEVGEGDSLVLIPSSFATCRNRQRLAPSLAKHFRVLALNYVGTGESDKPTKGFGYSPQQQSDVIAGFLDALGIARTHLMGVSYGGTIVLSFAGRHADRTGKVVSIEGYVYAINGDVSGSRGLYLCRHWERGPGS